jgi:hypothetical protein
MAKSISLGVVAAAVGMAAAVGTATLADAAYTAGSADMAMAQRNTSRREIGRGRRRFRHADKSIA